jgi:hypothetical protein
MALAAAPGTPASPWRAAATELADARGAKARELLAQAQALRGKRK